MAPVKDKRDSEKLSHYSVKSKYMWIIRNGEFSKRGFSNTICQWGREGGISRVSVTGKFVFSQWEHSLRESGKNYHQTFNIRRTLVGNNIVDHWDVVGASPVGAAPTTSSMST